MGASYLLAMVFGMSIASCLGSTCEHQYEQSCFELSKEKFSSQNAWNACEGGKLVDASSVEVTNIIIEILKSKNTEAVWVKGSSAFTAYEENKCPVRLNKDGESELLFNEEFEDSCEDKYKLKAVCEFDVKEVNVKKCNVHDSLIRYGYLTPCTKEKVVESGTTLRVECWTGYSLKGPEEITCQKNGKWSKRPICEPVCAASLLQGDGITVYPLVENARVGEEIQYYKLKETAMIVCENGFLADNDFPVTHKIITCLGSNRWSHIFPHCIPFHKISLSHALRPQNLVIKDPDHTSITLNCSSEDDKVLFKVWTKNQQEISMGNKYSVDKFGTLIIEDFSYGDEGHYVCTIEASPSNFQFVSYDLRSKSNENDLKVENKEMIKLKEGESKILFCKNSEYFSRLKWYKNGVPYFGTASGSSIRDDGALYLNSVSEMDNGLYICMDERQSYRNLNAVLTLTTYQVKVIPKGTTVCGQFFLSTDRTGVVENTLEEEEEVEEEYKEKEKITHYHEHTPWLVSIYEDNGKTLFSYGTLIHERWILTSASPFRIRSPNVNHLVARVGMDPLDKTDDDFSMIRENEFIKVNFVKPQNFTKSTDYIDGQRYFFIPYDLIGREALITLMAEVDPQELKDYEIDEIIIHPDYDVKVHNLALIYLKNEVPVTNIVRPLCLPDLLKLADDPNCEEARVRNGAYSTRGKIRHFEIVRNVDRLTYVMLVDILPKHQCNSILRERNFGPNKVCTKTRDDFGHDSKKFTAQAGSPLEVGWLNRYMLWGVFSEHPKYFVISFTKVLPYLDWIKKEMEKKEKIKS